jgi:hypothetical protein
MRLILGTVTVGALIVLPGCAKTIYEKPGATAAEFNQDLATCNYEAATHTQIPSNPFLTGMSASLDVGLRRNELLGLCLQAKGWRPQQQA